jgi:glycosyltransferase involved in cell wall biosynthesis
MDKKMDLPLITVGIPVFNGEKFLKKRLDSVLNQTYKNFEVIISDNASTDDTSKLCNEIIKKEKNIQYYLQKENIGYVNNFNFLIKKTNGKYFTFAAVDDVWEPNFLEKNVNILQTNDKIVGSIGTVKYFGNAQTQSETSRFTQILKKIIRKQDINILEQHVMSISGKYDKKIDKYLRFNQGSFVYGLFRANAIKKNIIPGPLAAWDLAFILNILKFGDLHVIDEVLYHKFTGGLSNRGVIDAFRRHELPISDFFLPNFSLFRWAWKNIGSKFCLRNLDWFVLLTIYGWYAILRSTK